MGKIEQKRERERKRNRYRSNMEKIMRDEKCHRYGNKPKREGIGMEREREGERKRDKIRVKRKEQENKILWERIEV